MEFSWGTVHTYLVLLGEANVHVAVQIDGILFRRVGYDGHGLPFAHDAVVVPGIRGKKVALTIFAVAGDQALSFAESRGRETVRDEANCGGGHCFFRFLGMVELN